eukprot:CAMPEP_0204233412 /NCGR_PEP_ID=MMETSP0361-20130328/90176_1 /ASSEMBLY_ACC=CAM_ASM_000343 /TAXON_ID=268821 /ORGANISM="Scrippsiella Hangoei, Strain SHTV-5" /LENGTH=48 /DNA_ID= /DNA_START= /DNA_END= /DNA_ORIENTATION=
MFLPTVPVSVHAGSAAFSQLAPARSASLWMLSSEDLVGDFDPGLPGAC